MTCVYNFECDEILLTLRSVTTTLDRCRREGVLRWTVSCSCGFRSIWRLTESFAVRFALDYSGGKLSNSGRTGLDLGLVCSMPRYKIRSVLCRALLFASCSALAGLLK